MSLTKDVVFRIQAKLAKGSAKDLDKAFEVIEDSSHGEEICDCLNAGKIRFKYRKGKKKDDSTIA